MNTKPKQRKNVTMIAFHGPKKPELESFLTKLLEKTKAVFNEHCPGAFESYELDQIHATLLGMEAYVTEAGLLNANFLDNKGIECKPDIEKLQRIMQSCAGDKTFPMPIRFGFHEAYCACGNTPQHAWRCAAGGAHSCDRNLYEGSFYLVRQGPVMITGWKVSQQVETLPQKNLYNLRKSLEGAGFLDKFHSDKNPHWLDYDLYLRIGTVCRAMPDKIFDLIQQKLRKYLEATPFSIDLTVDDISIVAYKAPSLAAGQVLKKISLTEFLSNPSEVKELFQPKTMAAREGLLKKMHAQAPQKYRAIYVVLDDTLKLPLVKRLMRLWWAPEAIKDNQDDRFYEFYRPVDQRGEATLFGPEPHLTVLDVLTMRNAEDFDRVIREIVRAWPAPRLVPRGLAIYRTALVIECVSPELGKLRDELIKATRHLIDRQPLSDEEIQRAYWWITERTKDDEEDQKLRLQILDSALEQYRNAGSPPLPTSRHFRLREMVGCSKKIYDAQTRCDPSQDPEGQKKVEEKLAKAKAGMKRYLLYGEPAHYGSSSVFHCSIVSGLSPVRDLKYYRDKFEKQILEQDFPPFQPAGLAIMGEDCGPSAKLESAQFRDSLTGSYVPERRPGFKTLENIQFNPASSKPATKAEG